MADSLRNRTGEGVLDDSNQTIEGKFRYVLTHSSKEFDSRCPLTLALSSAEMLQSTSDGRMYVQLRDVLIDRHGVHPLDLHDSTVPPTKTARDDIIKLMLRGMPEADEISDSEEDAPGEDDADVDTDAAAASGAGNSSMCANYPESRRPVTTAPGVLQPASSPFAPTPTPAPSGRTGTQAPGTRKAPGSTAYDHTIRTSAANSTRSSKGKGKDKEDVGAALKEGFSNYRDTALQMDGKKDERMAKKQKMEHEKLELDKKRADREAEKHKLEMDERARQNRVAQVQEFLSFYDMHLTLEMSGEMAFGERWPEVRPMMEKVIQNRVAARKAAEDKAQEDGEKALNG